MLLGAGLFDIKAGVMSLLLGLDGIVYNFIQWFYEIFLALARLRIFTDEDYSEIVNRIYIIIGVIMLFVLSYSLLRAIVNPDEFSKGEKSVPNIIKNILVSLAIIVLLPTVFDVAYQVQSVVLNSEVIGKLILNEKVGTGAISNGGNTIATNVFRAFFSVNEDAQTGDFAGEYNVLTGAVNSAFNEVYTGRTNFYVFRSTYNYRGNDVDFPEYVANNAISYTYIISTLAGAFILWCILLFCFDLGIRVVKLIYYQIVAPIAVVCRVLPGGKTKNVFGNWVKATVSTFLEVFIRVAIMYLGVYLITLLVDKFPDISAAGNDMGLGTVQRLLVKAFLIMGIVAFIRQAPKLIQNVFGIEAGGLNLGFKKALSERLGAGGAFAAGALVGGATSGFVKNLSHGVHNIKQAKGFRGKTGALLRTATGVVGGTISAGTTAAWNNLGSKNLKETRENTAKAVEGMTTRRDKRESYRATHGGTIGAIRGHASDAINDIKSWSGFGGSSLSELLREQNIYQEGMAYKKELFDLVSDDSLVMAYQGSKKAAQEKDYSKDLKIDASTGEIWDPTTGNYVYDENGKTFTNLNAAANYMKAQEVDMYDNAIKLASMNAIHKKVKSGDGRFLAQFAKYQKWMENNGSNSVVASLGSLRDITDSESAAIDTALRTGTSKAIDSAKKTLENTSGTILANDTAYKKANGRVSVDIANKRQEEASKKNNSK